MPPRLGRYFTGVSSSDKSVILGGRMDLFVEVIYQRWSKSYYDSVMEILYLLSVMRLLTETPKARFTSFSISYLLKVDAL